MGLDRNQLVVLRDTLSERILRSAVPVVLGDVVAQDRSTRILADEVRVIGGVRTRGRPLTVVCRRLVFEDGAAIDTSGNRGIADFAPGTPRVTPPDDGREGADGQDGDRGGDAGAVEIDALELIGTARIVARGGDGGRGQDGADGRRGSQGGRGEDATIDVGDQIPPRCRGRAGGRGGGAGLPGRRGAGGDGGLVKIRYVKEPMTAPAVAVDAGVVGDPAQPGRPGRGGDGGGGGEVKFQRCRELVDRGPRGPLGDARFTAEAEAEALSLLREARNPEKLVTFSHEAAGRDSFANGHSSSLREAALVAAVPFVEICTTMRQERAPGGPNGDDGDPRQAEVELRQQAPPSNSGSVSLGMLSLAELAGRFDDVILELLACDIEDQFRRAGGKADEALRARIEFLLQLCVEDPTPSPISREVMARAYAMARKLALGLDFFGFSKDRAPLLAFESYSNIIDLTILPQAAMIEAAFVEYWAAAEQTAAQRQQIVKSRAAAEVSLGDLEAERTRVRGQAAKLLLEHLPLLEKKVDAAFQLLMAREEQLTAAIRNKNEGCDLVGTLTAAATIVAGVATGGGALIAAASAGVKLVDDLGEHGDSLKDLWDNRKLIGDDFKELGKEAGTFADAVTEVREAIDQLNPEQRRFPQFRMERAKFDDIAREFADLPEAQEYREAGYDFLKCTESRNQAILEYNALLAQLVEYQARIAASQRVIGELQTVLNGLTDPSEPMIVATMNRLYRDTLSFAGQMVHSERKALAYHFADPSEAPLSALNVATVTGAHQRIRATWVSAKERFEARRELAPELLSLDLRRLTSADAWEEFKRSGRISFTIRREHPHYVPILEALPGLRLTGLSLLLPGAVTAQGQTQIPWTMVHGGYEKIYRADGSSVPFSHRPVVFSGFTPTDGGVPLIMSDFSERSLYAGVSPFASWLLAIRSRPELGLDLAGLTDAEIRLSGYIIEG